MNLPVPLAYEGNQLRTVTVGDEALFCVPDVCAILEHTNPSKILERLDPRDIRRSDALSSSDPIAKRADPLIVTDTLGRFQAPNWVTESGLYDLVFESRKPQARAFRRWVTSEVLPQIRRTGRYEEPEGVPSQLLIGPGRDVDESWVWSRRGRDVRFLHAMSSTDIERAA